MALVRFRFHGLFQVSLNWANGAIAVQPLSFMLLGASFMQANPYAPYVFALTVPVGALAFLLMRRSLAAGTPVESTKPPHDETSPTP
jgi:hypothetical protein